MFSTRYAAMSLAAVLLAAAPMTAREAEAAPIAVGLELVLAVDVSQSVDATEYDLQKAGYINAFRNGAVQQAIMGGQLGSIAVTFVEWSGSAGQQQQTVGWTLIDSVASANAFADAIEATTRAFSGMTGIGAAIHYATGLFNNDYDGLRKVIDVSGDGVDNDGGGVTWARGLAVAEGIVINGLPIGADSVVADYYAASVIGGADSFIVPAADFDAFAAAIERKLVHEIRGTTPVPEPASLALFGLGLAGLVAARRRR